VDLHDFRLAGVDADLGEDGHQSLSECLELLPEIEISLTRRPPSLPKQTW
jgi:hypothetical protein